MCFISAISWDNWVSRAVVEVPGRGGGVRRGGGRERSVEEEQEGGCDKLGRRTGGDGNLEGGRGGRGGGARAGVVGGTGMSEGRGGGSRVSFGRGRYALRVFSKSEKESTSRERVKFRNP